MYKRQGKSWDYPIISRVIEGKTILESHIPLQLHDVFIAMSDGAIYAGVGKSMNFGWLRENIVEYIERLYDDTLSAKMIASLIEDCLLYTSTRCPMNGMPVCPTCASSLS